MWGHQKRLASPSRLPHLLVEPWRIGGILTPGDGVHKISSLGTMFVFAWSGHLPHQDCPCPPSLLVDPWRIGDILMPGDGVQMSVSSCGTTFFKHYLPQMVIIIMNNFGQAFFARNCHLPCQDWPCPPSLLVDPWRIGGILMTGDGIQMSASFWGTTLVKLSLAKTGIFHACLFGSIFLYIIVLSQKNDKNVTVTKDIAWSFSIWLLVKIYPNFIYDICICPKFSYREILNQICCHKYMWQKRDTHKWHAWECSQWIPEKKTLA